MRMDDMNKMFEERGFTVERKWESDRNGYRFTIAKDDLCRSEFFVYPKGVGPSVASKQQREFVEGMIARFRKDALSTYKIDEWEDYCKSDIASLYPKDLYMVGGRCNEKILLQAKQFINRIYGATKFSIKDVIFNDPATIVIWLDGSKTVVKCQDGEAFDPEKGLAMAISKKALGNKHNYYHTFLRWLKKYEKKNADIQFELKCSNKFSEEALED